MKICVPESEKDFEMYYDLRWQILRKPWNQPKGSEKDEMEKQSIHIMACEKVRIPVGVGRLHFNSPREAQIRYMAVEENCRDKGIGTIILKELEKRAKERGANCIVLNARESAVPFYEKKGYAVTGKAHTLFGSIPHFRMRKDLFPE